MDRNGSRFPVAAGAAIAFAFLASAHAEVARLDIVSKRPYGSFATGDYVFIEAKVHGEISPKEPIPGLDQVAANQRGNVEYASRVVMIVPSDPSKGNGTLLVDIPNRGNAYAPTLYNSPREEPFTAGTFEQGTGFLQDRGFAVAEVYWEYGKGAELPSFAGPDGKRQFVEGVGFAIVRDTADFLAHASADTAGNPNPLSGAVRRMLLSGKSQSGRFVKSFLFYGFNRVGTRRVFDGMQVFGSGPASVPIMRTTAGPESSSTAFPTFDDPEGDEYPLMSIADLVAAVLARGEAPPAIFAVNTTTDYFSRRASLARSGLSGSADQPLPPNVRIYDIAGASHVIVPKAPASCTLAAGRLDWAPVSRALLLRLQAWVADDVVPPSSKLMPLEEAAGGAAVRAPMKFAQAVIQVPKRDEDGNAIGGIRLPDLVAPLGTHEGLNEPKSRACMLVGAYRPFALTKEQRESAGDKRLAVAERYRNRDDYVNRIRIAATELMREGFLLPTDAAVIIESAASSAAFPRRAAVAQ